jgi:hypothetical protein
MIISQSSGRFNEKSPLRGICRSFLHYYRIIPTRANCSKFAKGFYYPVHMMHILHFLNVLERPMTLAIDIAFSGAAASFAAGSLPPSSAL